MKHAEREERFVHQWDTLRRDHSNQSKQTMIDSSGTLRTLWTNNGIPEANARHRLNLRYPVYQHHDLKRRNHNLFEEFNPTFNFKNLIYSAEDRPPTHVLTMLPGNAFMSIILAWVERESFTVADIINHVANNYGAAHWGKPRGRFKPLSSAEDLILIEGIKLPLHAIADISMCTLLGTAPLYSTITGRAVNL